MRPGGQCRGPDARLCHVATFLRLCPSGHVRPPGRCSTGDKKEAEAHDTAEPEGPDSPSQGGPSFPDARPSVGRPGTGDRVASREGARPAQQEQGAWKEPTQQQAQKRHESPRRQADEDVQADTHFGELLRTFCNM